MFSPTTVFSNTYFFLSAAAQQCFHTQKNAETSKWDRRSHGNQVSQRKILKLNWILHLFWIEKPTLPEALWAGGRGGGPKQNSSSAPWREQKQTAWCWIISLGLETQPNVCFFAVSWRAESSSFLPESHLVGKGRKAMVLISTWKLPLHNELVQQVH